MIHHINEEQYFVLEKISSSKKIISILILISLITFFIHPFFPLFIFSFYVSIKTIIDRKNFMMKYARDNNLNFEYYKKIDFPARLFKRGNEGRYEKNILNLISGKYQNYPINIFHYKYSVGSGKNKSNYFFTVCELEITGTVFPFILLKSDSMGRHARIDRSGYDKDAEIKLEKQFDDKFNLYCQSDYEIEVLQIFDKELLSYLVEHGNKFSIEFADQKIYIYDDKIISNEKDMDELYDILKKIVDKSAPLLKRMRDDFESMHEAYNK